MLNSKNMANTNKSVLIYGSGGHASVIVDIIEKQGQYQIEAVLDDNPDKVGQELLGHPIRAIKDYRSSIDQHNWIVAIGDNFTRKKIFLWLSDLGGTLVTAIHPSAIIAKDVTIERGSVVMAGVVINPRTTIGLNCIINTSSSLDHDNTVGDHAHIAPGVHLSGTTTVGESTLVGTGSATKQNVTIGINCIIGVGSVVVSEIPSHKLAYGNPCKVISSSYSA